LGYKIVTLFSCPISLAIGFVFYSTLLILIYTKIRLHLVTVCPSGPCIELPHSQGQFSLLKLGGLALSFLERKPWERGCHRKTTILKKLLAKIKAILVF